MFDLISDYYIALTEGVNSKIMTSITAEPSDLCSTRDYDTYHPSFSVNCAVLVK